MKDAIIKAWKEENEVIPWWVRVPITLLGIAVMLMIMLSAK